MSKRRRNRRAAQLRWVERGDPDNRKQIPAAEQNWKEVIETYRGNNVLPRTGIIDTTGDEPRMWPALLHWAHGGGLCNRLRGRAGAAAIASIYNLTLVMHWEPHTECPSNFMDVFALDTCAVMNQPGERHKFNWIRQFGRNYSIESLETYQALLNIPDDVFWPAARKCASELKLLPQYADKLEAFMETVPKDAIGLHVRRTDHRPTKARGDADTPLYAALDRVVAETPDATFLLCTDNLGSVQTIRKRLGDRVFWREQHMVPERDVYGFRCGSIADAAIDLYSLARTTWIMGIPDSTFSDYAAFMGDTQIQRV